MTKTAYKKYQEEQAFANLPPPSPACPPTRQPGSLRVRGLSVRTCRSRHGLSRNRRGLHGLASNVWREILIGSVSGMLVVESRLV